MSLDFTVVICTFNHASLLAGVLDSLYHQTLTPNRFEILVIDNGSTDETAKIVREYQNRDSNFHLRSVYEPRQGLGYARNAALEDAEGDYLAYLDDDARASPDWLSLAVKHITSRGLLQCLGGPILPFYTANPPTWFKNQYESRNWGDIIRPLNPGESLSGSNMIWHKETLVTLGGFDVALGMKGRKLSVGEETMIFRRLWQAAQVPAVIYDPALIVYHWVPPYKMSVSYYLRRAFVTGQVAIQLDQKIVKGYRWRTALRSGGAVILYSLRALIQIPRYKHWQNWCVEECRMIANRLGTCMAACGITIDVNQN